MPLCTEKELMDCEEDVCVITPQINELECVEIPFDSQRNLLALSVEPVEITYDSQKSSVTPLVI